MILRARDGYRARRIMVGGEDVTHRCRGLIFGRGERAVGVELFCPPALLRTGVVWVARYPLPNTIVVEGLHRAYDPERDGFPLAEWVDMGHSGIAWPRD